MIDQLKIILREFIEKTSVTNRFPIIGTITIDNQRIVTNRFPSLALLP